MIECPQVAELIVGGYLVKSKIYAPVPEDIAKGVRTEKGDYVVSQLARRMNTDQLVGDVVADWLKHGERRRTVAFAVDVAHSVHIRNAFLEFDVRAEHLDGSTPKTERDAILARLGSGETEVVTNCAVDRRLGHAGRWLPHSGEADAPNGPLSANHRPRSAACARQA
jgi:DNA repair protein RadD